MPLLANIDALSDDGRGIARVQGKVTFIEGALPGEQVHFQILRRRKSFDEAQVVSIEIPSASRVEPNCSYFGRCGGCALQHLDPDAQLTYKEANVWLLLKRLGQVEPEKQLPAVQAEVWHYRHRVRLHVQGRRLGFKALRQNQVVDITHCPILTPALEHALSALNKLVKTLKAPERIREINLAEGKEGVAMSLEGYESLLPEDQAALDIFHTKDLTYPLQQHAFKMNFEPSDFTQANVSAADKMLTALTTHSNFQPRDKILELYCGLGLFSLHLASLGLEVLGVEGSLKMVQRARANAEANHLSQLQFTHADLTDSRQLQALAKKGPFTTLLLDPPRTGAQALIQEISLFRPKKIVYISCNPATLARDAHKLVYEQGYRFTQACVIDLFPQTAHVEVMAWFEAG